MPERRDFQYTILRVVPRIERGECINVGVVVFCRQHDFLGIRIGLDEGRLRALAPDLDPAAVEPPLEAIAAVVAGEPSGGTARAAQPVRALRLGGREVVDRDPALGGPHGPDR